MVLRNRPTLFTVLKITTVGCQRRTQCLPSTEFGRPATFLSLRLSSLTCDYCWPPANCYCGLLVFFLAGTFLTGPFFAGPFLAVSFLAGPFLADAFLAAAVVVFFTLPVL